MSKQRRISLAAALVVVAGSGYLATPARSATMFTGCTDSQVDQIIAYATRKCGGDGWTAYADCPNEGTVIVTAVDC